MRRRQPGAPSPRRHYLQFFKAQPEIDAAAVFSAASRIRNCFFQLGN